VYHFNDDYREEVTLRDGSRVLLRLVHPHDKAMLARGLAELSDESRYLRFFSNKRALSEAELSYLTELDQDSHFALGAVSLPDESRGLGVARFVKLPDDAEVADPAVAVVDDMQRLGLGRLLFLRLVAAAAERGVLLFRAEVLAENAAMRQLLQHISPATVEMQEGELVVVRMPLPAVDPAAPLAGDAGRGTLYQLLSLAAEGLVRVRRVLNLLTQSALPRVLGQPEPPDQDSAAPNRDAAPEPQPSAGDADPKAPADD
jgi:GNAT superfamily N-acetyltransferase